MISYLPGDQEMPSWGADIWAVCALKDKYEFTVLGEGRGEDEIERNIVGRGHSMYEGVRYVISWCVQATRNPLGV